VLIADASALFAGIDVDQGQYRDVAAAIQADGGPLVVSPFVLAELDYLLLTRVGVRTEVEAWRELAEPPWLIAPFDDRDLSAAADIVETYTDQRIGLADASIVVLAQRHRTDRILTLDRRHFSVLRQGNGQPFTILPG
jgi:predicted nucleic acid-binding protein